MGGAETHKGERGRTNLQIIVFHASNRLYVFSEYIQVNISQFQGKIWGGKVQLLSERTIVTFKTDELPDEY